MLLVTAKSASAEAPYQVNWGRQPGTSAIDGSSAVAGDAAGNVYTGGITYGSLGGPSAGGKDGHLRKYDSSGNLLWARQFGTSALDECQDVSADAPGNVFVAGYTEGSLGGPNAGLGDALVMKYNSSGTLMWARQFGTSGGDAAIGASADTVGNIYTSGYTGGNLFAANAGSFDAFLTKHDSAGNLSWGRQIGTSGDDYGSNVSADPFGNVYIGGITSGSLYGPNPGSYDAFVSKYDGSGNPLWGRQISTSAADYGQRVSADASGNVYVAGYTGGSLYGPNAGDMDAFLAKYDSSGNLLWGRQFGTSGTEHGNGVWADTFGNVYISGPTTGSLYGPNAGSYDAFVSKYDGSGNFLWGTQIGTSGLEDVGDVLADAYGNVYIGGHTDGSLFDTNAGAIDGYLVQFQPVPEPSGVLMLGLGAAGLLLRRGKKSTVMGEFAF